MNPMGKLVASVSVYELDRKAGIECISLFMNPMGKLVASVSVYEPDRKAGIECICL